MNWYCLTCIPQKEFVTEEVLKRRGVEAFVPVEMKYPRRSRKRRGHDFHVKPKRYCLFGSRYVFAGFEGVLPGFELSKMHLITGVVGIRGKPLIFSHEAIEALAKREKLCIPWRSAPNPHKSFRAGDKVEVMSGPFQGQCLEVQSVSGDLAKFIFWFLGKEQPIELPLACLEAA